MDQKKLEDLLPIEYYTWEQVNLIPGIYCNDQEPLNFNFYETYELSDSNNWCNILKVIDTQYNKNNLKRSSIYNQALLIHSEIRSENLKKYQSKQWITVYYWSHALLALDWFRYAEHVVTKKESKNIFLIYNRAWSGTREYRLKFADLLVDNNLVTQCKTSVKLVEDKVYYANHKFLNLHWKPKNKLEHYFNDNLFPSTISADFDIDDYSTTDIEIVLETLFDDDRVHLTEKSLRPIACGQPFILAATHGSLEYLKNYGFKTFSDVFDERYDQIENPKKRLHAIIKLMKQIASWATEEKTYNILQLQKIADYNKQYFFSKEFFNKVTTELTENLTTALTIFNSTKNCSQWTNRWNQFLLNQSVIEFLESNQDISIPTKNQLDVVYQDAIKYIK